MGFWDLFGFQLKRNQSQKQKNDKLQSFVAPQNTDGSLIIDGGYGNQSYLHQHSLNQQGIYRSDYELVNRYRTMSFMPEIAKAIGWITDDSIVIEKGRPPVSLNLDLVEGMPASIKKLIIKEFEGVLKLLDFSNQGSEIFRTWYIDGKLYFHCLVTKLSLIHI